MNKDNTLGWSVVVTVAACILTPREACAYVGPGAGLTAIGSVLALVGGVILAIVGFVWYPLKRLIRSRSKKLDSHMVTDTGRLTEKDALAEKDKTPAE